MNEDGGPDDGVIPTVDGQWRAFCNLGDGWVSDAQPTETDAHAAKLMHRRLRHGPEGSP